MWQGPVHTFYLEEEKFTAYKTKVLQVAEMWWIISETKGGQYYAERLDSTPEIDSKSFQYPTGEFYNKLLKTLSKERNDAEWVEENDIVYFKDEEQYIIYTKYRNQVGKSLSPGNYKIKNKAKNHQILRYNEECNLTVLPWGFWRVTPVNTAQIVEEGIPFWKEGQDFVFVEENEEDSWF